MFFLRINFYSNFLLILFSMLLLSCSDQTYNQQQSAANLLTGNKNIHCVHPVAKKDRNIAVEVWCGIEDGSSHPSIWFSSNGDSLSFMPWLSEGQAIAGVSVSDSGKYLSIVHVGEGHPYLIIYDIEKTRDAADDRYVYTFNPYPGSVGLHRWEGDSLLIETDYPVGKKDLGEDDLNESFLIYRVDIKQDKLIATGKHVKE